MTSSLPIRLCAIVAATRPTNPCVWWRNSIYLFGSWWGNVCHLAEPLSGARQCTSLSRALRKLGASESKWLIQLTDQWNGQSGGGRMILLLSEGALCYWFWLHYSSFGSVNFSRCGNSFRGVSVGWLVRVPLCVIVFMCVHACTRLWRGGRTFSLSCVFETGDTNNRLRFKTSANRETLYLVLFLIFIICSMIIVVLFLQFVIYVSAYLGPCFSTRLLL